jgi:MOSC domain-containing protein YiiM
VSVVVAVSRNGTYAFSKPVRDRIRLLAGLGVEGDAHAGTTVQHRGRVRADPSQPNLRQVHLLAAELFDEVREQGYEVAPGQLGENVTTRGIDLLGLPPGTILRFGRPPDGGPTGAHGQGGGGAASAEPGGAALTGVLAAADNATLDAATAAALTAVTAAAERDAGRRPGRRGAPADPADPRPAVIVAGLRNPCKQINGLRPGLLKCVLGRDDAGNPVRKAGVMGVVLCGGWIVPGDPIAVDLPPGPHRQLDRV